MSFVPWLLCLSLALLLLFEGVTFHRATVCRQEAWLKSTELKTRTLLTEVPPKEFTFHAACRLKVNRSEKKITWSRGLKLTSFDLPVEGKL